MADTPRYVPHRALPPYAYVPGVHPHPTRDPRGHSAGEPDEPCDYHAPETWRDNERYLWGVELYNHGYLWEAHEAWEGLWHAAKGDPDQADHLQGLIQCAAACLKIAMEQPRGLETLSKLGTQKLERVAIAQGGSYMGVDLFAFIEELRDFAQSAPAGIGGRPRLELALD